MERFLIIIRKDMITGKLHTLKTNRMKLKKLFFVSILMTGFLTTVNAQQENTSVGLRLGYDNGITLKHFFRPSSAGDFIVAISPNYFMLTGLYEYQRPIPDVRNLDWYIGAGAHIGGIHKHKDRYSNSFLIGIDLIGGLQYRFPGVPINVSLDWKPTINFTNSYNDYWYSGFALSVRYIFR